MQKIERMQKLYQRYSISFQTYQPLNTFNNILTLSLCPAKKSEEKSLYFYCWHEHLESKLNCQKTKILKWELNT